MGKNNNNKDKFYFFKVDKDKIKLQLKKIGNKFTRKKSKKRLALLISFFLLVGVGIAIYTMDHGSISDQKSNQMNNQIGNNQTNNNQGLDLTSTKIELNEEQKETKNDRQNKTSKTSKTSKNDSRNEPKKKSEKENTVGVVTEPAQSMTTNQDNNQEQDFSLLKPVSGETVRSKGWYFHPIFKDWRYQPGLEFKGNTGDIVMAADSGKVIAVSEDEYKGVMVKIDHGQGWKTVYGHLQKASVSPGKVVGKGQEIGRVGQSGITDQPALYFELLNNDSPVNPREYIE